MPGKRQHVAGAIPHRSGKLANGLLALRARVQVTQCLFAAFPWWEIW
jgi:hypothetical protein